MNSLSFAVNATEKDPFDRFLLLLIVGRDSKKFKDLQMNITLESRVWCLQLTV